MNVLEQNKKSDTGWLSAKAQSIFTTIKTNDYVLLALIILLFGGGTLCFWCGLFYVVGSAMSGWK